MKCLLKSPRIVSITWGEMVIDGIGRGRDFKLWPGGGREWDWSETGTHHNPGIQPEDVEELLTKGSEVVVLSRGISVRLKIAPETIKYLKKRRVKYHAEETQAAVKLYNKIVAEGKATGGLFHVTC